MEYILNKHFIKINVGGAPTRAGRSDLPPHFRDFDFKPWPEANKDKSESNIDPVATVSTLPPLPSPPLSSQPLPSPPPLSLLEKYGGKLTIKDFPKYPPKYTPLPSRYILENCEQITIDNKDLQKYLQYLKLSGQKNLARLNLEYLRSMSQNSNRDILKYTPLPEVSFINSINYSELCAYCRDGWVKPILRILKKNNEIDILWRDGQLLQAASQYGGAEILNILIDYYIAHISGKPESDKYLSAMSKLIEALNIARQLSESFTYDVTEIFNKYIPVDYEEISGDEADFVEDTIVV